LEKEARGRDKDKMSPDRAGDQSSSDA
jgi:hypothetical protein